MLISELVSYAAVWGCAFLLDKRLTSKSQMSAADLGKSENRDFVLSVLSIGHEQNISLQAASFNATDAAFLEAVAAMHNTPAVTVTLAEDVAPNKTIDSIISLGDAQKIRDEICDSRGSVEHFVSYLLMGLSLLPLLGIYYTIFKSLRFALVCYGHPLQEDGSPLLSFALTKYKYAMYFWLIVAAVMILEPFLSLGLTKIRRFLQEHSALHEAAQKPVVDLRVLSILDRYLATLRGHGVFIKDLGEAKLFHACSIAAHVTSLKHARARISRLRATVLWQSSTILNIERRLAGISQTLRDLRNQVAEMFDNLNTVTGDLLDVKMSHDNRQEVAEANTRSIARIQSNQENLSSDIDDLTTNLARTQDEVIGNRDTINNLISSAQSCSLYFIKSVSIKSKIIGRRMDFQHHQQKKLERQNADQAEEILELKHSMESLHEGNMTLTMFYRRQNFSNINANEYYHKTISSVPDGQLAPIFMAYMTAMNMQVGVMNEAVRRTGVNLETLRPSIQQSGGYGMPQSAYSSYASPGGFLPQMRR